MVEHEELKYNLMLKGKDMKDEKTNILEWHYHYIFKILMI